MRINNLIQTLRFFFNHGNIPLQIVRQMNHQPCDAFDCSEEQHELIISVGANLEAQLDFVEAEPVQGTSGR